MPSVGYRKIVEHLRDAIRSGRLSPGAPVSSEPELSKLYGVTRTTVRRALAQLEADGLLETVSGKGRFVRTADRTRLPTSRFELVADDLRRELADTSAGALVGTERAIAERFNVSQGTARRALQSLADGGLVTAIPGRGWFTTGPGQSPDLTAATARALRSGIGSGEWQNGTTLPGEAALARRYGVARVTVRRALSQLENEGLLSRRVGEGRVVLVGSETQDRS